AALAASIRRLEETHRDYAEWDDAVRNLYGEANQAFLEENFSSSALDAVFFDTAFLVDEVGGVRYAVHKGETLPVSLAEAYGGSFATLSRELIRDGFAYDRRSGVYATKWGLAIVAVGTVVPRGNDFEPRPNRSRLLVLSKVLDAD